MSKKREAIAIFDYAGRRLEVAFVYHGQSVKQQVEAWYPGANVVAWCFKDGKEVDHEDGKLGEQSDRQLRLWEGRDNG